MLKIVPGVLALVLLTGCASPVAGQAQADPNVPNPFRAEFGAGLAAQVNHLCAREAGRPSAAACATWLDASAALIGRMYAVDHEAMRAFNQRMVAVVATYAQQNCPTPPVAPDCEDLVAEMGRVLREIEARHVR
ncbi:hypothetical protein [Crossiella sp. NPDC003009]